MPFTTPTHPNPPQPTPTQNAGFIPNAITLAAGGTVRWASGRGERVNHPLILAAGGVAVDGVLVEPGTVVSR